MALLVPYGNGGVREGRTKEGRESLTGREKVGSRLSDGRHERTAIH